MPLTYVYKIPRETCSKIKQLKPSLFFQNFQLKAVPYSRDYKRKYEFFRRKLKKQVSDTCNKFLGMNVIYTESNGKCILKWVKGVKKRKKCNREFILYL